MFTPGSRPQAGNSWAQPKPDTGVLEDPSVIGGRRKLAMNRGRASPEASSHLADVAVLPLTDLSLILPSILSFPKPYLR